MDEAERTTLRNDLGDTNEERRDLYLEQLSHT